MPREVAQWRGASDDARVPPRVRLRVWDRCGGICAICTRIIPAGEPWECDHIVALANGGEHAEGNMQVLCGWCHKDKTRADVKEKSRTYKRRASHAGIKRRRRASFATNKDGTHKRRMDGTVERR